MSSLRRATVAVLVAPIRLYQLVVSPLLGPRCRFYPSCSSYAVQALRRHGPVKGTGCAVWRVLRCHPWNAGGLDPVPPARRGGGAAPAAVSSDAVSSDPVTHAAQGAGT